MISLQGPCLGLGIIASWGPLLISMVLRSEESLKSEMLGLAQASKYVKIRHHTIWGKCFVNLLE